MGEPVVSLTLRHCLSIIFQVIYNLVMFFFLIPYQRPMEPRCDRAKQLSARFHATASSLFNFFKLTSQSSHKTFTVELQNDLLQQYMSRVIMALVQISYGKLAESLVRALLPTFLLTPFLVQTVTYSKILLFYNIPLNSSNSPTSKPKIKKSRFRQLIIVVGVAIKRVIPDLSVTKCGITPCEGIRKRFTCGILDLRNICSCNPESWPLESGIQLQESGIPLTIGIRNPNFTGKSGIHGVALCELGKMQYWTHIFLVEKK